VGAGFEVNVVIFCANARLIFLGLALFSLNVEQLIAVFWSFFHGLVGWESRLKRAEGGRIWWQRQDSNL
jgi:hypothetical protein